jgi:succinoglycan biosynthesis transport protein ExoP
VPAARSPTGQELGVAQVFDLLRNRWKLIAACGVVGGVLALAVSLSQPEKYAATSSLLFRLNDLSESFITGVDSSGQQTNTDREAATNIRLISLDVVGDLTARRLGGGVTGAEVRDAVTVEPEGNADVVSITATTEDPRLSARMATTFAEQYIEFRRRADRERIGEAERLADQLLSQLRREERKGARGRALKSRIEDLSILASLQAGNAELVERARVPATAASPVPPRDAALGVLLGLLIGVASALVAERLDRRVRKTEEVEAILALPLLGGVPESRALRESIQALGVQALPPNEAEAFQVIRANLRYFNATRPLKSVLVTSAQSGDGKTAVSANLAAAAAMAGAHVILINADLRKPGLGFDPGQSGLSDVLAGTAVLEEAVQHETLAREDITRRAVLDVLGPGHPPPNPIDLIDSDQMRRVITSCEEQYELVILDAPPITVDSDAIPLIHQVGGVIVVTRLGTTSRTALRRLRTQLDHLGAPVLGVVVNSLDTVVGYGYEYAGSPKKERPAATTVGKP